MRRRDPRPEAAMWLIVIAMILTVMIPASCNGDQCEEECSLTCTLSPPACQPCIDECRAANTSYQIPRSVGLNIQVPDTGTTNAPWWRLTPSQPLWQTLEYVRDELGITAVGHFLRSHPWDHSSNDENIRRAFRTPGIEIIQISPQYWGSQRRVCSAGEITNGGITWLDYPTEYSERLWSEAIGPDDPRRDEILDRHRSIFEGLLRYYADQPKHIIVSNNEASEQLYSDECSRDVCDLVGWWCDEMGQACCDDKRLSKAEYLLTLWNRRQYSAEAARDAHPGALLRVWHAIEVNQYERTDKRPIVPLCDIIPRMPHPPDRIGLSGLRKFGDPEEALRFAQECTGLPVERFYISEVATKVGRGDQYEWIYNTVDTLFRKGIPFAMVWSYDTYMSYEPNWPHSVTDPLTGAWRPGMYAIRDLNEKWRNENAVRTRRGDGRRIGSGNLVDE